MYILTHILYMFSSLYISKMFNEDLIGASYTSTYISNYLFKGTTHTHGFISCIYRWIFFVKCALSGPGCSLIKNTLTMYTD